MHLQTSSVVQTSTPPNWWQLKPWRKHNEVGYDTCGNYQATRYIITKTLSIKLCGWILPASSGRIKVNYFVWFIIITVLAVRQCAAWASTLTTRKHSWQKKTITVFSPGFPQEIPMGTHGTPWCPMGTRRAPHGKPWTSDDDVSH